MNELLLFYYYNNYFKPTSIKPQARNWS